MPAARRKATKATESSPPSKKRVTDKATETSTDQIQKVTGSVDVDIRKLYHECVLDGSESQRIDKCHEWDDKGAIAEIIWPFLTTNLNSKEYFHACHLLVILVSLHFWEGSFSSDSSVIDNLKGEESTINKVLETLLYKTEKKDFPLQTQIIHFLIVGMASNNAYLHKAILNHTSGVAIMHWLPSRRQELELKKSAGLRRKFTKSQKKPMWIVQNMEHVMALLEGHSEYGPLVNILSQKSTDPEDLTKDVPLSVWNFLHRSLEFLIDLLSATSSRYFLSTYLDAIHFSVRCRLSVGNRFATPENLRLVQHLLSRVNGLLAFPIDGATQSHLSKVDVVSRHHSRATTLQKMAYRHFPQDLQQVVYAGVGLLCAEQKKSAYLDRFFVGFSDKSLLELLYKMRLVPDQDPELTRDYLLQVLGNYLSIPPYPMDQLRSLPLYPTEAMLWDHSIIPPSSSQLRATQALALPKLNARFLSFQDYLLRNFELVRLESAYEIRSDLVNVIKRLRPVLRQSMADDDIDDIQVKTQFDGWSRMALELVEPFRIVDVQPPKLGENVPSRVLAEVVVDLEPCGDAIRREWDEIGEFDNIFLVTIDASKMSGDPAPYMRDYHLHHGARKIWDSDSERRVPDEEDSTFPSRFGVTLVRGCMVLQVRNEQGTVLSEPGTIIPNDQRNSTKRIFKVMMDSAQFAMDSKSSTGTDKYQTFNLVVRRHGRENNFKAVLETIRGLLEGAGSIDRVIPPWFQSLVLGQGDPASASYKSETMKVYAMNTVGVNKPSDFLDFGDTFIDEDHLRESFEEKVKMVVKSNDEQGDTKGYRNFKLQFRDEVGSDGTNSMVVEAMAVSSPLNSHGNPVRFTPVQVEAIRSGLSPGLTLVVGPPGTGKTDVAVQIIASLFHSFPTQRTIIITHSNAALNDIFSKVMARGDVDERYFVRLGAGERDLNATSTHDFTKIGRVAFSIQRRDDLLEQVQQLSESLGISGKAQRGPDGTPSYTCETAAYFHKHEVLRRQGVFKRQAKKFEGGKDADVTSIFPFCVYFGTESVSLGEAQVLFGRLEQLFTELAEYRPYELLRSQRQRSDYLITKQARIVAMTCTHAAIARSNLIELGFEYDNIVMEESAQMLEIESFIPCLLQRGKSDESVSGLSRLKRICMLGDHNQLPPVVKNSSFSKYSNFDQSLFTRLIRLGVPYVQLDKQGRARPELMKLYSWRYNNLGNLNHVLQAEEYQLANPGFVRTCQMINVDDFEGKGETSPTPYWYQNVGEAEYVVALFQYMVLIGYSPDKIAILTTYNGQKELISDVLKQRCGQGTPLEGVFPKAVSTVDQYQGQQADFILLSLVRTRTVGHLRDIRRLVVAVSRARLGLYIFCRKNIFCQSHELKTTMDQLAKLPSKLQLVLGETNPTDRKNDDAVPKDKVFEVEDVSHLGSIVHTMQAEMLEENQT